MVGATGIEVEVDTETGQFRIVRMENVGDCGTPLSYEAPDGVALAIAAFDLPLRDVAREAEYGWYVRTEDPYGAVHLSEVQEFTLVSRGKAKGLEKGNGTGRG